MISCYVHITQKKKLSPSNLDWISYFWKSCMGQIFLIIMLRPRVHFLFDALIKKVCGSWLKIPLTTE